MTLDEILSDPNVAYEPIKHNDPFRHICKHCSYFRSDLDDKHKGLCTVCDMPISWAEDDEECRWFEV